MNTPMHILILLYSCQDLLCTHYKMEMGPPEFLLIFTTPENKTAICQAGDKYKDHNIFLHFSRHTQSQELARW